jgi:hypothetical protein
MKWYSTVKQVIFPQYLSIDAAPFDIFTFNTISYISKPQFNFNTLEYIP